MQFATTTAIRPVTVDEALIFILSEDELAENPQGFWVADVLDVQGDTGVVLRLRSITEFFAGAEGRIGIQVENVVQLLKIKHQLFGDGHTPLFCVKTLQHGHLCEVHFLRDSRIG